MLRKWIFPRTVSDKGRDLFSIYSLPLLPFFYFWEPSLGLSLSVIYQSMRSIQFQKYAGTVENADAVHGINLHVQESWVCTAEIGRQRLIDLCLSSYGLLKTKSVIIRWDRMNTGWIIAGLKTVLIPVLNWFVT